MGRDVYQYSEEKEFVTGKHICSGLVVVRRHCPLLFSDMEGTVAGLPMTAQGHCLNEPQGAAALRCSHRQTVAAIMCLRHVSHNVSYIEHCDTYEEKTIFDENADTTSFAALCLRGKGANIKRQSAYNSLDASEKKVRSAHIILLQEFYHLRVSTERVGRRTPELERIRMTYFSEEGSDIYSPVPAPHRTESM